MTPPSIQIPLSRLRRLVAVLVALSILSARSVAVQAQALPAATRCPIFIPAVCGAPMIGSSDLTPDRVKFAISVGVLASAMTVAMKNDIAISREFRSTGNTVREAHLANLTAEYIPAAVSGGAILTGLALGHPYLAHTGAGLARALGEDFLLERGMKQLLKRSAVGTKTEGQFFTAPSVEASSFPSGHSMAAFSFARVLSDRYPEMHLRVPLYALATGVAVSRVHTGAHFTSDVIMGGTLGYFIAGTITHGRTKKDGKQPRFAFSASPRMDGGVNVAMNIRP